ncbi:hypothetical protein C8J55DRAFT_433743 [Lentinula edodes]|uniref:ATP-dependent DNA helicase n=1 Tax=Lentinula lateritia TaxID=40482 RepID=A0A9W9DJC9_9AGAR|nr:hypothetical protein C8J55DRAFT_433743 [Lentinula edodes]
MPGYCQVKRKVPGHSEPVTVCRFDYPMALRDTASVGLDSRYRPRFEPMQNDPILNTYNPALIMAWRANIDVKPVLSKDAALNYIAKYASKSEQQAPEFPQLLGSVLRNMDENSTTSSLFAHCRAANHSHPRDTLRDWVEENCECQEEEDIDEDIHNPDVEFMDEVDWQMWARDHLTTEIPHFTLEDLEQKVIFDRYVRAYEIILAGDTTHQHLFNIDGTAGCGKTYLIRAIYWSLLQTRDQNQVTSEERLSFADKPCLYTTRDEVHVQNLKELKKLNIPCAKIRAKNDGGSEANAASADVAGGLENTVILARGAKVMITRNIWQTRGQFNCSLLLHTIFSDFRPCECHGWNSGGCDLGTGRCTI